MRWYIILIAILGYKVLINTVRLFHTKNLLSGYLLFLRNNDWDYVEKKASFISLMKSANIPDGFRPNVEPAGFGFVSTSSISVQSQFPSSRRDLAEITVSMFHQAIGVYKKRLVESFNPLYWIELVVFLPKHIFSYLGAKKDGLSIKIMQLLWWLLTLLMTTIFAIYKKEIYELLNKILKNAFQ